MKKGFHGSLYADRDSIMDAKRKKGKDQQDVLLMAKRARQERDRADVRSGARTPESMTFNREEAKATFVLRRRSFDY